MMDDVMNDFNNKMSLRLGEDYDLRWETDRKGVVCGWCRLTRPDDIVTVAELIADRKGRIMTISPMNTPSVLIDDKPVAPQNAVSDHEKPVSVVINYHFFFAGINLTVSITLPDAKRAVKSITPVLKSADWHEREMQELYNIKLQGHPNPKRLFLDKNIHLADQTMIPLSEAMNGASTNTLWEKIMKSGGKEADQDEQL